MDMSGYLFVYFTGESNDGEQVFFSLSNDGLHWDDLNYGLPILRSSIGEGGVRDPFILRAPDNSKYYIIATDLRIANNKGWQAAQEEGSRSIIIWESDDLVHWSEERAVEIGIAQAGCVWAPEAIYDKKTEEYLVFWASLVQEEGENTPKQRIYYSKTKDFHTFTKAVKYLERENHVIDTTIVEEKGFFYRFYKDETTKNIKVDRGKDLISGPFTPVNVPILDGLYGVEGPTVFPLQEHAGWCLLVDQYATQGGYLPLITNNIAEGDFQVLQKNEYSMGSTKKRHGSILALNRKEYDALHKHYAIHNPVLKGFYADPELVQFGDTFYIFPTTDGYHNWSGTEFHVFSSKDLKEWIPCGTILDVSKEVPWSVGSAWAPAITCKEGRYYFYFCAKRVDGVSCIGVAVADKPTGPYVACNEPLITPELMELENITMSQTIDPSLYMEEDGRVYLLFGNGGAAIVPLNDDMVSITPGTVRQLHGAYDFREAITVFKRNGLYHFTWSCDDTASIDYHINYGISDSLFGPISYQYPILEKSLPLGVYGTGHHSILRQRRENIYYIAYHRLTTPLLQDPKERGFHREVCLDLISFDENGLLIPVQVTK